MEFFNVLYTTTSNSSAVDIAGIVGGFLAALGFFIVVILGMVVAFFIGNYKLFQKMGLEGWKSLIPNVNTYFQLEATGVDPKWLIIVTFGSVLNIIPLLGALAFGVIMIYFMILSQRSLARAFGKSTLFTVGLVLLNPIFICILAFGSSKYIGKDPMNDMLFGNKNNNTNNNMNGNVQPTSQTKSNQKYCTNCGAANSTDTKFCASCGKEL